MVQHVGDHASKFTTQYGNISTASIGAIRRGLLALESEGGDKFFGEAALNIADQRNSGIAVRKRAVAAGRKQFVLRGAKRRPDLSLG